MNSASLVTIAIAAAFVLAVISIIAFLSKRRRRPLNVEYFAEQWKSAQGLCAKQETWPLAVINADKVLDDALKKCGYRGKSMGERLAAAQRDLSNNDSVWYGHKLRNKLVHESDVKLTKRNVQDALVGIRQALRDLGALR
jgi:hypothetical protein